MVSENCPVVAFVRLVKINGELDRCGLCLLLDALLHIAGRLPNLQETFMRVVINRVGVDPWPNVWLRRENFVERFR